MYRDINTKIPPSIYIYIYIYVCIHIYTHVRAFRIYSPLCFVEAALVLNPARLPNDT